MKRLGLALAAIVFTFVILSGYSYVKQGKLLHVIPITQTATVPTSVPTSSEFGTFLRFGDISGQREIVIKTGNGTEPGFPLVANVEYIVSPPNLKVKESYLQSGDQVQVNAVQPQAGYRTAVSIVDYAQHSDLKTHLITEDLFAGVSLKESTWSNLSNTVAWKLYNKSFDGDHFYFKYPGNMQFFDEDASSPLSFSQLDSNNQPVEIFQIIRYWAGEAMDSHNFLVWYRTNISMNNGDTLTEIDTIHLPKNTVYRVSLVQFGHSVNTYVVAGGKSALFFTKADSMSEQDLYTVINTLNAYCLVQCP